MRNDTDLLKELLGFFSTCIENDLEWPYNECIEGLRDICNDSVLIDELVKRRSELYGEVDNGPTTFEKKIYKEVET